MNVASQTLPLPSPLPRPVPRPRRAVPRRIGEYEVERELGAGGMGMVLLARHVANQTPVALKLLHADLADDPGFRDAMLDEARVGTRLCHPHLVAVTEVFDGPDGTPVLVMPFIPGADLGRLRRAHDEAGGLPAPVALRVVADALLGLEAAHGMGLVHRDISPSNLLVGADGRTRVVDFGIALSDGRISRTRTGFRKGKLAYMSPEQVTGGEVGPGSDLFSIGVVLWEVLCGASLFRRRTDYETVCAVERARAPRPSGVAPALWPFDDIVSRALAPTPGRRFRSAAEMGRLVEAVAARTVGLASRAEVACAVGGETRRAVA